MANRKLPQMSGVTKILALVVAGVLVIAVAAAFLRGGGDNKIVTASFPRTVSVYEGSDVRVVGVKVGTVDEVKPSGTTVKVTMSYDPKVKFPADAKAVIIAPSVVGDRFVQFTPVYKSGPALEDNAVLGTDRTATPIELDEIYQSLDDLAVALGPEGANKDGALSRLLDSTAKNFGGQGRQFKETIHNLSRFTSTLDNNKEELFGTARQIEVFVKALADNDTTVRNFNDSLASAADLLEGERDELAAALRNLGTAMTQVRTFVKENRNALSRNIKGLVKVTQIFVRQRDALDETLRTAPTALSNLFHTYNPRAGTLDTRTSFGQNVRFLEQSPSATLCALTATVESGSALCDAFKEGLGRSAPGSAPGPAYGPAVEIERIDRSLAGILEVER